MACDWKLVNFSEIIFGIYGLQSLPNETFDLSGDRYAK